MKEEEKEFSCALSGELKMENDGLTNGLVNKGFEENDGMTNGLVNKGFDNDVQTEKEIHQDRGLNLTEKTEICSTTQTGPKEDNYCGISSCRPVCLQRWKNVGCFTAAYSMTGIVTSALNIYMNSQITTLEKHFNMSSSVSGVLMSCNDFGFLVTTLIISYYTRRVHVPRALGFSTIMYGISGLLCTIAFFGSRIEISSSDLRPNVSLVQDKLFAQMCSGVKQLNGTCDEISNRVGTPDFVSDSWKFIAICILAVGMILQGVAKSPRQPFVGTYIDDNTPKSKTSMYLGIMIGLSIFGPALAFILGGVFSKIYITLEATRMGPRDPRWLGAWWLGFLLFGSLGLVVGIPLFFFPRHITLRPGLQSGTSNTSFQLLEHLKGKIVLLTKGFFKSMLRLLKNPVYACITVSNGVHIMCVSGMMAFMPKYLETQYTMPAWQANMYLGTLNVFAASLGTVVGGCVTTKFKLSPMSCLKLVILCKVFGSVVVAIGFVTGCDQPIIHKGYTQDMELSTGTCIHNCNCDNQNFFPICGADDRIYFSPCHAGCTSADITTMFVNCSCLSTNTTQTATSGLCDSQCNKHVIYLSVMFFGSLIMATGIMPGFITSVRSVQEVDKPLAIGLSSFSSTLIGWFPGPILFGALVDSTCLMWKTTCQSTGACSLYNLNDFRFRFHALAVGLRMIAAALSILALLIAIYYKKFAFLPNTDIEMIVSSQQTELSVSPKQTELCMKPKQTEHKKVT
ncbi:unnamed protein product [Lymnaea stagnalis]|uniref:Solute carrier organic anion transporter family member n=1 Tax=Lymnaea stagnalis TaxID=6523 RepID=A0AAV2HTK1_LYMST